MISIVESISNLYRDKCDFIVSTKLHFRIMLSEHVQEQAFFSVGCKRSLFKWLYLNILLIIHAFTHSRPLYTISHFGINNRGRQVRVRLKPLFLPILTLDLSSLHPHSEMYWLAAMWPQWVYVWAVWWKAFCIDAATVIMNMHHLLIPIDTNDVKPRYLLSSQSLAWWLSLVDLYYPFFFFCSFRLFLIFRNLCGKSG